MLFLFSGLDHAAAQKSPFPLCKERTGPFDLFPLDRGRRFGGNIVHHAVDIIDFVHDAGRDFLKHIPRNARPVRRHAVDRRDGPDADGILQ